MPEIKYTPIFTKPTQGAQRQQIPLQQQMLANALKQASSSEPIYSPAVGVAKMGLGGITGFMMGQEQRAAEAQRQNSLAGIMAYAKSKGMDPATLGLIQANPSLGEGIAARILEQQYQGPLEIERKALAAGLQRGTPAWDNFLKYGDDRGPAPDASFSPNVGNDQFGRPRPGWTNPRTQTAIPAAGAATPPGPVTLQGPSGPVVVPAGQDPVVYQKAISERGAQTAVGPKFEDVSAMRKEIQQLPSYKNLAQAAPIYKSMTATAGTNSKASDLNLVYGLGKIFDPGSVVREGEMTMVKNTASWPEWLKGVAETVAGGAALSKETRQSILAEAHNRVTSYADTYKQDTDHYREIAGRQQMDPRDIIQDFGTFDPWKAPADTGGGTAGATTPPPVTVPVTPGAPIVDPLGIR